MPTEQDLRAAFRDLASHAPETDTVLAVVRTRQTPPSLRPGLGHRPGWPRFAAAIAAAAAVCLVAGLSVAISGGGQARHPAAGSSLLDRVPRYYMMLLAKGSSQPYEAVIRDTVTGKVLATVRPPSPFKTFSLAAAAPNDRTFVLAARPGSGIGLLPTRLYRAQFNPARRSIQLTPLPIPEFVSTTPPAELAVSPDATELAVALDTLGTSHNAYVTSEQIRIYSLAGDRATGPVKVWYGPPNQPVLGPLSWARTGVLATWTTEGVRLLRTDSRSGSLVHDSRLALRTPTSSRELLSGILTTDGTKIAAVWHRVETKIDLIPGVTTGPKIEEFSAATGKLIHVLMPRRPSGPGSFGVAYVAWTNSSGSVIVGVGESSVGKNQALELVVGSLYSHTFKTILRNAGPLLFANVPAIAF